MTPEQLAARWLADVREKIVTLIEQDQQQLLSDYDVHSEVWKNDPDRGDAVRALADAIVAAITRDLAPGDDLVAQATAALEGVTEGPWEPVSYQSGTVQVMMRRWNNAKPDPMRDGSMYGYVSAYMSAYNIGWQDENDIDREKQANARFIAFTRQWVPEAAARLSALTAQVAETQADRDKWFEGAGAHHVASMKQAQRADQAEAEVSRLRDRLAKLVDAAEGLSAILDKHETKGPLPDVAMMLCWLAAQNIRAVLRGNILEKPE